jgi:hypothetical protein
MSVVFERERRALHQELGIGGTRASVQEIRSRSLFFRST